MPALPSIDTLLEDYRKSIAAFILLATCFLFLYNLGAKPFWDYDEATYAMVAKDTLATGQPCISSQTLGLKSRRCTSG
jgi:4-amino-4-deoxy-L-arabinose transferase-like glycosyltransferase